MEFARHLSEVSASHGVESTIHIEVDTGMGRSGVDHATAADFVTEVTSLPGLRFEGLFTHFPNCDGSEAGFEKGQQNSFVKCSF